MAIAQTEMVHLALEKQGAKEKKSRVAPLKVAARARVGALANLIAQVAVAAKAKMDAQADQTARARANNFHPL